MAKVLLLRAFALLLIVALFANAIESNNCPGEGWTAYEDEKCFKLIKEYAPFSKAEQLCQNEGANSEFPVTLISIKSAKEQKFLANWIFNQSNVQVNVWLGAKRTVNQEFEWPNGDPIKGSYANWGPGSPSQVTGRACVEMKSELSRKVSRSGSNFVGTWQDVTCQMANFVVCQKPFKWTYSKLIEVVVDLKNQLNNAKTEIAETKQTLIPVGFVHVQLPKEKSPTEIWPSFTWTDISSNYAGLFFRAVGGDAAAFGSIQEADSPRLIEVRTGWESQLQQTIDKDFCNTNTSMPTSGCLTSIPTSGNSKWSYTGKDGDKSYTRRLIRFVTSGGEVRPENMAVKIWKRTG